MEKRSVLWIPLGAIPWYYGTMWIIYSLIASILWGLDYTLAGKLLEKTGFPLLLALQFLVGFLVMLGFVLSSGAYKAELPRLFSTTQSIAMVVIMIGAFVAAHVCIVLSIENKTATLASLIEMSYPIFVVAFSWLLFREASLHVGTVIGGALVFAGVSMVYFFNQ